MCAEHSMQLLLGQHEKGHTVHPVSDFPKLDYAAIGDAVAAMRAHVSHELLGLADFLDSPDGDLITTIEIGAHGMFRSLLTGASHLHTHVANHTQFAPGLHAVAERCIKRMADRTGSQTYNGIHLRIEGDFGAVERIGGAHPAVACLVVPT